MSIKVMNLVWERAPVQSGELLMLLALADNADYRGSCYPSVPYLARKARMSERNAQLCLRKLSDAGYIKTIPNGGRHGANLYCISMDLLRSLPDEFVPCRDDEGGENISPPKNLHPVKSATKGVKNDASRGEAHFTQTVIEPSDRTSQDAQAHESGISDDQIDAVKGDIGNPITSETPTPSSKETKRQFQTLVNNWPNFAGMSLENSRREFDRLSTEDQTAAVERRDAWLAALRRQGKDHTPAPSTYLKERLWETVPATLKPVGDRVKAAPFGKAWMHHVLTCLAKPAGLLPPPSAFQKTILEAGGDAARMLIRDRQTAHGWPHVNRIYDRIIDQKETSVPANELATMPEMEAVAVNSRTYDAWRIAFHGKGWPWPKAPDAVKFVWFPVGGPPNS